MKAVTRFIGFARRPLDVVSRNGGYVTCSVVVGGQYGSEGKGKVVALLTAGLTEPWVVRCGGPNSGHSVVLDGQTRVLRQLPTGVVHPGATLLLGAGCAIDEMVLLDEVETLGIERDRIIVDPRAVIITEADRLSEQEIETRIASTASGTGAALARRVRRTPDLVLAGDSDLLAGNVRIERVAPLIHEVLDRSGNVIVEGTQGFGLSLLHGTHFPHVTSRDTTAAGFMAEVGLSPSDVSEVVMVVRTFPIRVGGPSGPLDDEITWEDVCRMSGAPKPVPELTSVTGRVRRVAKFDLELVLQAARYNRPTGLAVMGLDRLDYENHGIVDPAQLSALAVRFLDRLGTATQIPIQWVGTGFGTAEALDVRRSRGLRLLLA